MTIHTTFKLLAVAVALAGPVSSQAGFVLEKQPEAAQPPIPSARKSVASTAGGRNVDMSAKVGPMARQNRQRIDLESKVTSRITQSGTPPTELPVLRGMGRSVTMEDALRQVLPGGWSAFSDQDLPVIESVDWDGNRTWPMVLHSVLARYDMRANIDWETQEVMLFVPAPAPAVEAAVASAAPAATPSATASATPVASAPVIAEAAPKVQVKEVVWTLSTDRTLRENLRAWASAAGWNLVWSATVGDTVVDYPVDAKVDFAGELVGVSGAMAKVIAAYADADHPLEIEFYKGNKVVEVRLHRVPDVRQASASQQVVVPARVPLPPPPPPPPVVHPEIFNY